MSFEPIAVQMSFEPVEVVNDWGVDRYSVAGKPLPDGPFEAKVRFPDGYQGTVRVERRTKSVPICDMGHSYTANCPVFVVPFHVHSFPIEIPLRGLHVDPASIRPVGS